MKDRRAQPSSSRRQTTTQATSTLFSVIYWHTCRSMGSHGLIIPQTRWPPVHCYYNSRYEFGSGHLHHQQPLYTAMSTTCGRMKEQTSCQIYRIKASHLWNSTSNSQFVGIYRPTFTSQHNNSEWPPILGRDTTPTHKRCWKLTNY